jgi:hypothetical protein
MVEGQNPGVSKSGKTKEKYEKYAFFDIAAYKGKIVSIKN